MKPIISLLIIFITTTNIKIVAQHIKTFSFTNKNLYTYYGIKKNERHTLTFKKDSTFHITVPDNSGSCWNWGEHGGRIEIKRDTLFFYLDTYVKIGNSLNKKEEKEIFIFKNKKTIERISSEKFMFESYKLTKRKNSRIPSLDK